MTSILTIRAYGVRFGPEISGLAPLYVISFTFALLSERCNFVKTVATKIFMGAIFVENFMSNIFCNMKFFSKVHISRVNREKVIMGSLFDPLLEGKLSRGWWFFFGDTWGHAQELPTVKF